MQQLQLCKASRALSIKQGAGSCVAAAVAVQGKEDKQDGLARTGKARRKGSRISAWVLLIPDPCLNFTLNVTLNTNIGR